MYSLEGFASIDDSNSKVIMEDGTLANPIPNHMDIYVFMYDRDFKFCKNIAYGTMETAEERLNVRELINHKDELVNWIDNKFTSKEDFTQMLKDMNIIYTLWKTIY